MKDRLALLDAIHLPLCRPEYAPEVLKNSDGTPKKNPDGSLQTQTHCNGYVNEVCQLYGYKAFDGLRANDMVDRMYKDSSWALTRMEECQDLANEGTLIIAAWKNPNGPGHVCVICPGKIKDSGRWDKVPSCANVGEEVFIGKGIGYAFRTLPLFFAWRPTL